jgi:hypothetical protein
MTMCIPEFLSRLTRQVWRKPYASNAVNVQPLRATSRFSFASCALLLIILLFSLVRWFSAFLAVRQLGRRSFLIQLG